MTDVTRILADIERGDGRAAEELLPLVYAELRALASQRLAGEGPGHTLQPTALVHEAYIRLVGDTSQEWENRRHFFAAAAQAMRRILIESARKRKRLKRGGDRRRLPANLAELAETHNFEEIVAVDDAIRRLEEEDPQAAEIVRLRFFAGLSVDQTAEVLERSPRTVAREWTYARAWLFRVLQGEALGRNQGSDHEISTES